MTYGAFLQTGMAYRPEVCAGALMCSAAGRLPAVSCRGSCLRTASGRWGGLCRGAFLTCPCQPAEKATLSLLPLAAQVPASVAALASKVDTVVTVRPSPLAPPRHPCFPTAPLLQPSTHAICFSPLPTTAPAAIERRSSTRMGRSWSLRATHARGRPSALSGPTADAAALCLTRTWFCALYHCVSPPHGPLLHAM